MALRAIRGGLRHGAKRGAKPRLWGQKLPQNPRTTDKNPTCEAGREAPKFNRAELILARRLVCRINLTNLPIIGTPMAEPLEDSMLAETG